MRFCKEKESSVWNEGRDKCFLVFRWELNCFDEEKVLSLIAEKMKLLMQFETEFRPQFS